MAECNSHKTHNIYPNLHEQQHRPFIGNKNIKANIFRIKAYDSITWKNFCIGFIDFMLVGKTLTEFTNLF